MSIETLTQLENKIQNAVDTISLQKMEMEELRDANERMAAENAELRAELQAWGDRVASLLGKLDTLPEELAEVEDVEGIEEAEAV
ncbi:cell division protein ZapB [Endozoicomonadaceae bacterium StTr2]